MDAGAAFTEAAIGSSVGAGLFAGTMAAGASVATALGADTIAVGLGLAAVAAGATYEGSRTSGSSCESFTPDTLVLTAADKQVPISALKPGDKIKAKNTSTGKSDTQTVDDVNVNHDTDLYDLKVQTKHGIEVIHATANHPVWDQTTHTWVMAAHLHRGDHLQTADGTDAIVVGGTTPSATAGWMWDLDISTDHDFYVVVGSTAVLVHNCASGVAPNGKACSCNGSTNPSNADLVQAIATRAQARLGGSGAVSGTAKHAYADMLMTRYQGIYGSRGLVTEQSYLAGVPVPRGTAGSARPDVFDPASGIVYDYKFVKNPGLGIPKWQADKNALNVPGATLTLEVNP